MKQYEDEEWHVKWRARWKDEEGLKMYQPNEGCEGGRNQSCSELPDQPDEHHSDQSSHSDLETASHKTY